MEYESFILLLDGLLKNDLQSKGFIKKSAGHWIRKINQNINLVSFQKQSSQPLCCVILGVHYDFLENIANASGATKNGMDPYDCEIQIRLTVDRNEKDHWWSLTENAAHEIAGLVVNKAPVVFEAYDDTGKISKINLQQIENDYPELLLPLTRVRACLLLAKLHENHGEKKSRLNFPLMGLASQKKWQSALENHLKKFWTDAMEGNSVYKRDCEVEKYCWRK